MTYYTTTSEDDCIGDQVLYCFNSTLGGRCIEKVCAGKGLYRGRGGGLPVGKLKKIYPFTFRMLMDVSKPATASSQAHVFADDGRLWLIDYDLYARFLTDDQVLGLVDEQLHL